MNKQDKIEQLLMNPNVHATRKHLESKSDKFINALYTVESMREELELDAYVYGC